MKPLFLALVLVLASGCLGASNQASRVDQAFRSRVDSVTIEAGAQRSAGISSITAGATIKLRDPRTNGLSK